MLMIVIFVQYMDVQQRVDAQASQVEAKEERVSEQARITAERLRELERQLADRSTAQQQVERLSQDLDAAKDQLEETGGLIAQIFDISDEELAAMFKAENPGDTARVRQILKQLADSKGPAIVRHALAVSELQKRCDLWDLHIENNNEFVLKAAGQTQRFRADSRATFETGLFRAYRTFPQPKGLVIILCTWGWNTSIRPREAAYDGLPAVVERMTADSDRRSRFEFAWLGPLDLPKK